MTRIASSTALAPLLLLLVTFATPAPAPAEPMVRIEMAQSAASATFRAERLRLRILSEEGGYQLVEGGTVQLHHRSDGVEIGGRAGEAPAARALKLRADGPIHMGELTVRGAVEIRWSEAGLQVINEVPMERYLAAVLGSEMPPSFPPEALKAQAVAARTYAIGKKIDAEGQPFHLGSTVLSQVYGGVNREDPRTHAAVKATAGEVLVFEHAPIEAYFFSSCGGETEGGAEALGRALPYLVVHACPEKADVPNGRWTLQLSAQELGQRLGLPPIRSLRIATRTSSGRARTVELGTAGGKHHLDAVTLRRRIGYSDLRSLAFEVEKRGSAFLFRGRGSGHAAGMCQWGAAAAAEGGASYQEILQLYYPGTELRRMY